MIAGEELVQSIDAIKVLSLVSLADEKVVLRILVEMGGGSHRPGATAPAAARRAL